MGGTEREGENGRGALARGWAPGATCCLAREWLLARLGPWVWSAGEQGGEQAGGALRALHPQTVCSPGRPGPWSEKWMSQLESGSAQGHGASEGPRPWRWSLSPGMQKPGPLGPLPAETGHRGAAGVLQERGLHVPAPPGR